jgi:hypothetical protein
MGNFQDRLQEAGHAPARAHETLRLVICSDLVQEYKDASVATIRECYETMVQVYGRCWCCFTQEQFEAVFSLAFADPEAHFRLWRIASDDDDVFDVCNVFQVFCALFLLCDEPLQVRQPAAGPKDRPPAGPKDGPNEGAPPQRRP